MKSSRKIACSIRRSQRCVTPVDAEGPKIRWAMQETLWKSFLKKRVKPRRLAKQESCRQKIICWNCSKQNLRNKSWKNQDSSIDCQDCSAKGRFEWINSHTSFSLSNHL